MNISIILSGGIGTRLGASVPKQYLEVGGRPIVAYALDTFMNHPKIDSIIIAANTEWHEFIKRHVSDTNKSVRFSCPGETREHTIYNALKKAKEIGASDDDIVIIHDAVRPLVTNEIIEECLIGCQKYDASIATTEVKDTIYISSYGECITEVPERRLLHAGQTPEAFKFGPYLKIHDESTSEEISKVTGGAQFAQQKGLSVFLSKGAEVNFKITTIEDLERFQQIVKDHK